MPRQPRYFIAGIPQHVIQRGVDRQAVFFAPEDCQLYRGALLTAARQHPCDIHAYVQMTNHVHLLLTPREKRALPLLMQALGRGYVQALNRRYRRTGTLWEGRYKASLVQSDRYALACYRYIEMNPVRAGMVRRPEQYPHSSYRCNAHGKSDPLITPHDVYRSLDSRTSDRQGRYQSLFAETLGTEVLETIRSTTNACRVLGNDRFKDQIERMLGRSVRPGKSGRPRTQTK